MLSAELTASHQCVLRFFRSTCLKHCACHEKVMPSHTKCCTCHARINRDQDVGHVVHVLFFLAVWLSEQLVEIYGTSLVLRLPRDMHLCRSSSKVPRLPRFLKLLQRPHVLITLDKGQNLRLSETASDCPKLVRDYQFLTLLTWKRASRHNSVHFSTFQKCSEAVIF